MKRYKPLNESTYIQPNKKFRGWITTEDKVIEIPRGEEHWEYMKPFRKERDALDADWIRFYTINGDNIAPIGYLEFEVNDWDNKTFRRVYDFYMKHLKGDERPITVSWHAKTKYYKPNFK
jgi:hypothetical protein